MPKTWYGMPAYANAEGNVICFFQNAQKFGARYSTLGFNDYGAPRRRQYVGDRLRA